ncbi:MAG: CvpA family protein [Desulfovibrio sp.]|nr:CvpA family protein [Desulfovibrio sp.]MBI4958621.1 CvpA family protein [Desulfovibrio sp.]
MNIADLALLVIWGFFFFRGYFRGLIKEAASILALILGFKVAVLYSPQVSPHLTSLVSNPAFAAPAAFILIFVGVMIACSLLVSGLTALMKLTLIDWANKFFGGFFGLAKGIFITALVLWVWTVLLPKPDFMQSSRLVPVLEKVDSYLSQFIPADWKQKLKSLTPPPVVPQKKPVQEPQPQPKQNAPTQPKKTGNPPDNRAKPGSNQT